MLIITRKPGERIQITDGKEIIEIQLQWSRKTAASIAVTAPQSFRISRPKDDE